MAFCALQRALRQGGRICITADGNLEPLELDLAFHAQELSVVGSSDGVDYAGHARAFFDLWARSPTPLPELFEVRVGWEELPHAFERMVAKEAPLKVFVEYAGR